MTMTREILSLPKFKDKYAAARHAVKWAQAHPKTYVSCGGPMYPVPYEEYLETLYRLHNTKIVGSAGCEICNYEDVFADVVNACLDFNSRNEASRCMSAYCRGKKYLGYWLHKDEEEDWVHPTERQALNDNTNP